MSDTLPDNFYDMAMEYLRMTGVPIDSVLHNMKTMSLDELAVEYSDKESEGTIMGGKPQKNTPRDMRLAKNNPQAGKAAAQTKVTKAVTPVPAVKPKAK
jgi:hypothetical protein